MRLERLDHPGREQMLTLLHVERPLPSVPGPREEMSEEGIWEIYEEEMRREDLHHCCSYTIGD